MGRLSASRFPLLAHCGYFARPDVTWPPQDRSSDAQLGTAVHLAVELHPKADAPELVAARAALSPADAETFDRVVAAWRASNWSGVEWVHEVAFAYDPSKDRARVLQRTSHRDYSETVEGEIPGTADLVFQDGRCVTIADIKTGLGAHVEPAATNAQLRFLALAAARALDMEEERIIVLRVDEQGVTADDAFLDALELDALAAEIAAQVARIPEAKPDPGAHCAALWCPARATCPVTTQALATVESELVTRALGGEITTPEQLAWIHDRLPLAESALDEIKRRVRAYVDANGGEVSLGGGRVLRRIEVERESITLDGLEGSEAEVFLAKEGLGGAIEPKTSKAAIERALRAKHNTKGKALASQVADVMSELSRIGAVRHTTTTSYVERKAKE